jgi:hypothetical protein
MGRQGCRPFYLEGTTMPKLLSLIGVLVLGLGVHQLMMPPPVEESANPAAIYMGESGVGGAVLYAGRAILAE